MTHQAAGRRGPGRRRAPISRRVALLAFLVAGMISLVAGAPRSGNGLGMMLPAVAALADWPERREVIYLEDGVTYTRLDPDTNYHIVFPEGVKTGATALEGGRDILIDGAHIVMEPEESDLERRAIYIKDATGTVQVQNVFIEGVGDAVFDAIAISAPEATVKLTEIRVEGLRGTFDGFHGDIVQPFGGVKRLVVNGLTGRSNYQGFYLQETRGPIGAVVLRNVNLSYDDNPEDLITYLLWLDGCATYPVTLRNVYIEPRDGQAVVSHAVRPSDDRPKSCLATNDGFEVMWPRIPAIDGVVISGAPPIGDFVPHPEQREENDE